MTAHARTGETIAPRAVGGCCPLYHEAVELVGRRWTGAILRVLMDGPLRFSEVAQSIPELSDRLLSERMKELESRGLVKRTVIPGRAAAGSLRAVGDGPRARAGVGRDRDLGPALALELSRARVFARARRRLSSGR